MRCRRLGNRFLCVNLNPIRRQIHPIPLFEPYHFSPRRFDAYFKFDFLPASKIQPTREPGNNKNKKLTSCVINNLKNKRMPDAASVVFNFFIESRNQKTY